MSGADVDRFHNAARDGFVDLLKDATRRDCNTPDEDGMTPTLWAAACGNLDALRTLVVRGGDPNKSDLYGNTALHWSSINNHINCVTYLVNFGVNLFALDNDFRTPKELAGIKGHEEILRFLDTTVSKHSALNTKTVLKQKEKAMADAQRRVKELDKIHKKVMKKAEKDEKKLAKQRSKMTPVVNNPSLEPNRQQMQSVRGFSALRRDSKMLYESPRFSDIVSTGCAHGTTKKGLSGVYKKIHQSKMNSGSFTVNGHSTSSSSSAADFKVREVESDGKRSVRSLTGLRRDAQVLYVPKYDTQSVGSSFQEPRKRLEDVFDLQTGARIEKTKSEPFLTNVGLDDQDDMLMQPPQPPQQSLFERPGFGNVAFRQTFLSGTLLSMTEDKSSHRSSDDDDDSARISDRVRHGSVTDSIGSAGSLAHRNRGNNSEGIISAEDDDDDHSTTYDDDDDALETFLAAYDLRHCLPQLRREQIDLKALLLLDESDLKELGFNLGTRKKLMDAIVRRKNTLQNATAAYDSRL